MSKMVVALLLSLVGSPALGAVATQVSVGRDVACAVDAGSGLSCWGTGGAIGDGSNEDRLTPVGVVGLSSGVASVDVGERLYACAVTTAGAAKCWGYNQLGQLGDGTTTSSNAPVDVVGLGSGVAAISAGIDATCALTTTGGVKCWGRNNVGQLGDGTNIASTTPVQVSGLASGVAAISVGYGHACALTVAGAVKCWGRNLSGQLGDGTTTNRSVPVDVAGLSSGVVQISASGESGAFQPSGASCALTTLGGVKCWGASDVSPTFGTTPVDIPGLTNGVAAVSVGQGYVVALRSTGQVVHFSNATLGLFRQPFLETDVASLSAGGGVCAVTTAGEIQCSTLGNSPAVTGQGPVPSAIEDGGCVQGFGDEDGDALCDVFDGCVNLSASEQIFAANPRPRTVVTGTGPDPVPGNETVSVGARFALPPGVGFSDLAPMVDGLLVQLAHADGVSGQVQLGIGAYGGRGTAGWKISPNGRTWTYTDATGTRPVVMVRAKLSDRGHGLPGGLVDVSVDARGQTVAASRETSQTMVTIILGDASAGLASRCAQSTWSSCTLGSGNSLVCR